MWVAVACLGAAASGPVAPLLVVLGPGRRRPEVAAAAAQVGAAGLGFWTLVALLPAGLWLGVASGRGVDEATARLAALPGLRPALLVGVGAWELGLVAVAFGLLVRFVMRGGGER